MSTISEDIAEQFALQFKTGRPAPYPLWQYWIGVDGKTGDLGYEWSDKPHRLVFDLLHHSVHQKTTIDALVAVVEEVAACTSDKTPLWISARAALAMARK